MKNLTRSMLAPGELPAVVWATLSVAAVGVAIAGYLHGQLFWQGYSHVAVVGPLFLLAEIGSGATVIFLLLRRWILFIANALAISVGAVVSIFISHTTSFFGFAENAYGTRATTIVVCEIVAAVLCLVAAGLARKELAAVMSGGTATRSDTVIGGGGLAS
jgi:hypothetical protein